MVSGRLIFEGCAGLYGRNKIHVKVVVENIKWRIENDNRVDIYNKIVWRFDLDSQFQWHPFLMMVMEICLEVLCEMSYEVNRD